MQGAERGIDPVAVEPACAAFSLVMGLCIMICSHPTYVSAFSGIGLQAVALCVCVSRVCLVCVCVMRRSADGASLSAPVRVAGP